ncbi:MAG: hypothetical protein LBC45_00810 [Chlamydiales bacterium]|jgi:hypothetical protein|nr:hypothetical protein [Chlamydiales bacterium]
MIRNLFRRKKPLIKKKPSAAIPKKKQLLKENVKKTPEKILTAEGWKRLMMRPKKTKKS